MPDVIHLLPDHIANQIAAGEVIQRPASAVKELLENAIDAGATEIKLIVTDAGKNLVQVIDNGKGMSPTDARMAFERHATSKISTIEDLFHIRTMGFRGEALASIAAVAQVEVKTRRAEEEIGTYISIENSQVTTQEATACPAGTSISMKNVFFNVPARRNFLKSNTTELKNIIDEFTRVAMAFPEIHFNFSHNGQQVFYLEKGSQKQRIVQLLGNQYNAKLVPVQEETSYLTIRGFVGKPETARKTRGDQYLFANNRYIKSAYLNHAIAGAFADLIPKDSFPGYVLFLDLDPAEIDINVHPTKQEIKFTDEKIVYAFVQAAVKHALAQFSIAPSLDFSLDPEIQSLEAIQKPLTEEKKSQAAASSLYQSFTQKGQAHLIETNSYKPWKEMHKQDEEIRQSIHTNALHAHIGPPPAGEKEGTWKSELAKLKEQFLTPSEKTPHLDFEHEHRPISREQRFTWLSDTPLMQLHYSYIVAISNQGYMLVHQQYAHERVVYEQLQKAIFGKPIATQQSLFPLTFSLQQADAVMLNELLPEMKQLGYHIEPFGNNSFVVQGTPADVEVGNEQKAIEQLLDQYKHKRNACPA
ncbi:MAG: DNA mismatch repair endonuclease MutL [Chitinophagaceae bacterium]|nr:DNA mismatch repair endonuclease MutL [Chitinophagaceae bacterium]